VSTRVPEAARWSRPYKLLCSHPGKVGAEGERTDAATLHGDARSTWTVCGTPEYLAPEIILTKGHSKVLNTTRMHTTRPGAMPL
jgi:hypothetical protein